MPQISLYVDKDTLSKVEKAAAKERISISKWVVAKIKKAIAADYPQEFFDLFGSITDDTFCSGDDMPGPNRDVIFPLRNYDRLCFLKNVVKNPNIIVGDYTYYDDFENVENFEKNVKYHFDFIGDKLIIGKFCMIASDVKFIMNGANHLSKALTSYPFAIFGNGWEKAMENRSYPQKGDIKIGNDVWIGYNSTIMAGVTIGDGAIIATNSTVVKDVEPYSIVGGNPATEIRKRFPAEVVSRLLELKWWDWELEKITKNLQNLTGNDVDKLIL